MYNSWNPSDGKNILAENQEIFKHVGKFLNLLKIHLIIMVIVYWLKIRKTLLKKITSYKRKQLNFSSPLNFSEMCVLKLARVVFMTNIMGQTIEN